MAIFLNFKDIIYLWLTNLQTIMKKLLTTVLAAAIAASAGIASAQEPLPIGYAHTVSFGASYGYGSAPLANFLSGNVDFNIVPNFPGYSYLRARVDINADQIKKDFSASLGASFHYMQHITAGLYVYPFIQVKGEFHNADNWPNKADFTPGAGAGIEYQFNHFIGIFAQGAYDYAVGAGASRPEAKAGIVFAIGKPKGGISKAQKEGLASVVRSNAAKARAARNAAQRAAAEQAAADKLRKEAAGEAAKKPIDPETAAAYVAYQNNTQSSVSVPFVQGSIEIGSTTKAKILALVPYLMSNPGATVEILAYGDKLSDKADDTLATKRYKAVRDILTGAGISAERITTGAITPAQAVSTQPGSVAIVTVK